MAQLKDILETQNLAVHFQPIVCLKRRTVVGLEALARPRGIRVDQLFLQAATAGRLLELDRLCRLKAMTAYRELSFNASFRPLLFINFQASVIDEGVLGSGAFLRCTEQVGLAPSEIVIEINESQVTDTDSLQRFVESHREHGFLIALDDLGSGHSNLPRIAQLKPHMIKLDRGLIAGIDQDHIKQETMKSLVDLCRRIGSLVLAEGVETLAEVDTCASLGAEFFQGFYFSHPRPPSHLDLGASLPSLAEASLRQRGQAVALIQTRRQQSLLMQQIAERGRDRVMAADPEAFDLALSEIVEREAGIEAAYLLNHQGMQLSATHLGRGRSLSRSRLFAPAALGTDHSNKEYFFSLFDAGLKRFTTNDYISLATGLPCRTVSLVLNHHCGDRYVLCIDLTASS